MFTSMVDADKATNVTGQKITVLTVDQQLYSVVCDIMWANHNCLMFFFPQLGVMHWLMCFIWCASK